MRAFNVLLSFAFSLALGLALLEGGLRLIGKGPVKTLNRFDPEVGWSKEPGLSVARTGKGFHATFEINSLGLRDDPMSSAAKAPGSFRVLALGDSFTLGYTVERADLFVDLLESRWREAGRHVDVLNAGTEAWSTDQEAAWLAREGQRFQPDLVLLFPYENDLYWCGESRYHRFPKARFDGQGQPVGGALADPGPRPWPDRLAILKPFKARTAEATFVPPGASRPMRSEFAPLLVEAPPFLAPALEGARGSLLALQRRCEELGAKLVVAPIPSHSAIDPAFAERFGQRELGLARERWSPDRPVELYLGWCKELGIPALDAREALRASLRAGERPYLDLYEQGEWHFTPAGNRAFAGFLAERIETGEWVPAATSSAPLASAHGEDGGGLPTWAVVFLVLWAALSTGYALSYKDEPRWQAPLKVGAMLGAVFALLIGGSWLVGRIPPAIARWVAPAVVVGVLGFVGWKLGGKILTIVELLKAFALRGHWYLMPLVVVLLSIGSLLVVAASSPFVAPFIYTLF